MANDAKLKLPILYRGYQVRRDSLDTAKRTVRVQFASETPVRRWFDYNKQGNEVLDCDPSSVDMSRIADGAAVLVEHDPRQRCGITEGGRVTAQRTAEAEIRFAKTPIGDQMMNEVADGTVRWVSVGYRVEKFQVDEEEEEYRAVRWLPLEVSFVAIPADPTARVQRSDNGQEIEVPIMFTRSKQYHADPGPNGNPSGGPDAPPLPAPTAAPNVRTTPDFSRVMDEAREMLAFAAHYQRTHPTITEYTEKCIKDGVSITKYLAKVRELIATPGREDISAPAIGAGVGRQRGPKTLGERFTESDIYKNKVNRQDYRNIQLEISDECQFRYHNTRAALNATTEGLAGTSGANIDQNQNINILGQQPLFVSDLFAQGTTNGDVVRYVRESTFTNAAAAVTEGSAKPEATLDLGVVDALVRKVAVWTDVTEEMLSDFAQTQAYVNARLGYMVQAREDQHLMTGENASNQIVGILNTSGIQTISGALNTIDQYLRSKANVEGAAGSGFAMPDAFILHPANWLSAKLAKDNNGQYLFGGPGYAPYGVGGYSNVGSMWGLPVVSTVSMTQGTALCGAFRTGAQIFRRMGLTLKTTNSDGSKFQSNILTILAEQRLALAVYQPNKFCAITGIP